MKTKNKKEALTNQQKQKSSREESFLRCQITYKPGFVPRQAEALIIYLVIPLPAQSSGFYE